MSRFYCPQCKHVASTTGDPNVIEGTWLSSNQIQTFATQTPGAVVAWITDHGVDVDRCPACKAFVLVAEDDGTGRT